MLYNSRLIRWVDRFLPYYFEIEHMPGAKVGVVDCICKHPKQKSKRVFACNDQFIVAKLDIISAYAESLNLKSSKSASRLQNLLKMYNPAPQITANSESIISSIRTISIFDPRLHKHEFHLSPRSQNSLMNAKKYIILSILY